MRRIKRKVLEFAADYFPWMLQNFDRARVAQALGRYYTSSIFVRETIACKNYEYHVGRTITMGPGVIYAFDINGTHSVTVKDTHFYSMGPINTLAYRFKERGIERVCGPAKSYVDLGDKKDLLEIINLLHERIEKLERKEEQKRPLKTAPSMLTKKIMCRKALDLRLTYGGQEKVTLELLVPGSGTKTSEEMTLAEVIEKTMPSDPYDRGDEAAHCEGFPVTGMHLNILKKGEPSGEKFRPDYYALPNRLEDLVKDMPMFQGTATKYLVRAGKKNPDKLIEDLKKAAECLQIEIERLENGID